MESTFSERLKEALSLNNMSAAELCRLTNTPESVMSQYKSGKYIAKQKRLAAYSKILNVSIPWLLGEDVPMNIENDSPQLTSRDKKQIENILENTKQQLLSQDGLMFEGSPATEEDVQKILMALQMGMEMIKKENKEKYTPKKYRK